MCVGGLRRGAADAEPRPLVTLPPRWALKRASEALLVLVFYLTFCKSFEESAGTAGAMELGALGRLALWTLAIHLLLVGLAWALSYPFAPRRRVACVMIGPQKTEVMAIAILSVIFAGADDAPIGELMMPIVAYHSLQMLVASAIVPTLRAYVEEEERRGPAPQHQRLPAR